MAEHSLNLQETFVKYLDSGTLLAIAVYQGSAYVDSLLYNVDRSASNYFQVDPAAILDSIGNEDGVKYLQDYGVNLNQYRMRFVKVDHDDSLECDVFYLAGKAEKEQTDAPNGAFIFRTPN